MFPRSDGQRGRDTARCIFYKHRTADESELVLSYQQSETVMSMLLSIYESVQDTENSFKTRRAAVANLADNPPTTTTSNRVEEVDSESLPGAGQPLAAGQNVLQTAETTANNVAGGAEPRAEERRTNEPAQAPAETLLPITSNVSDSSRFLHSISPLQLSNGAFVSMFSSRAEYSALTRCHRTGVVRREDVCKCWMGLLYYASRAVLEARCTKYEPASRSTSWQSHEAPASPLQFTRAPYTKQAGFLAMVADVPPNEAGILSGVYVHRQSETAFELGIVTCATSPSPFVNRLLNFFARVLGVTFSFLDTPLPIGAALRGASLRLWWRPQASRVTPATELSAIKVVLEEFCRGDSRPHTHGRASYNNTDITPAAATAEGQGNTMEFFTGYNHVVLFLARPIVSQLRGTRAAAIPHTPATCAVYTHEATPAPRAQGDVARVLTRRGLRGFDESPYHVPVEHNFEDGDNALSPGLAHVTRYSSGLVRASFWFSDLSVTTVGEHLIGVEVRPVETYRPFLPTLCRYVTPFLVVPSSEFSFY